MNKIIKKQKRNSDCGWRTGGGGLKPGRKSFRNWILLLICIFAPLREAAAASVLIPLQTCGITPAANRSITLTPLQALGSNAIPVMDKIQGTTDANGNWQASLLPGIYQTEVRPAWGQIGTTTFYFYVDPSNLMQNAYSNWLTGTNNTWPPNQYAYSAQASDARYMPVSPQGEFVQSGQIGLVASGTNYTTTINSLIYSGSGASYLNLPMTWNPNMSLLDSFNPPSYHFQGCYSNSAGIIEFWDNDANDTYVPNGGSLWLIATNSPFLDADLDNNSSNVLIIVNPKGMGGPTNPASAMQNISGINGVPRVTTLPTILYQLAGTNVSYTANNLTAANAMNAATLGNFQAFAFSPTQWMTNPFLEWWSAGSITAADGTIITNWTGLNGNILQGKAIYSAQGVNGLPGIYFNGTGADILTNSTVLGYRCTNAATIFCVFRFPRQFDNNTTIFDGMLTNQVFDEGFYAQAEPNNDFIAGPTLESAGGGSYFEDAESFHNGDDTKLYCITWGSAYAGDYWDGKIDNSAPIGFSWNAGNSPYLPSYFAGTLAVGQRANLVWPLNGYVSELLIFTNQLSFAAIDQISTYFLRKYNLVRNCILLAGDSMIWGGTASWGNTWSDILATNFPNWTIDNVGVPGASSSQVLSNVLIQAKTTTAAKKVAIIWDNLENGGESLETITNNQILMGQTLQSNGWLIILVDPPSNAFDDTNTSATGTGIPLRFAYQNWATNNWQQYFNGFVDLARDPYLGYSNACTNIIYYPSGGYVNGGGTHWTNAAFYETAPYVIAEVHAVSDGYFQVQNTNAPPPTVSQSWWCNYQNHIYYNSNGVWALIH